MTKAQINNDISTPRTLADFGVVDLAKISTMSFHVDGVSGGRTITFRECSTVYVDEIEHQRRLVLRLSLDTKKLRGKRVPVPQSIPRFTIGTLKGYDSQKNMWGQESHEETYVDLILEEATAFHKQFEEIRSGMVKEKHHGSWYRSDVARAS